MKSEVHISAPPAKPTVIFDGDCNFCGLWIRRWKQNSGEGVEYVPFQDPQIASRFPELPLSHCEEALQLVETDGTVYSAAEAAFRALAYNPHERWLLFWYEHSRPFASLTEFCYRLIARRRSLFSALTRLGWGQHVERPSYILVRSVFLRSIGLIYLLAFLSLWVQISGLVGSDGIQPAQALMKSLAQQAESAKAGVDRFHQAPTLCWWNASDGFLHGQCAAGVLLAILVVVGIAPAPCLFLLWLIFLSLATVCSEFLGYQWESLLLETGLLAIFFAPLQWITHRAGNLQPSRIVLWLLRWLLFRLMFESGCVKLLSGDSTWRDLTALTFHYETQPLPTWIGWYAHQLPVWVQKASTAAMFAVELVVPFFIFLPRRLRIWSCWAFVSLQVVILATGNYCYFNLLTLALCLLLLDDAALLKFLPMRWGTPQDVAAVKESEKNRRKWRWPIQVTMPLACIVVGISIMELCGTFRLPIPWPPPFYSIYRWEYPLRSVNSYGLFAVMTRPRIEIVIEGSDDGQTWQEYEFKYKPGDLKRRPGFVAPHQPRVDWQMWFAALSSAQQQPWFINFCIRLLQGSPLVLGLLERNPFPKAPPRYIRALAYEYHFTSIQERRKSGAWWRREYKGIYCPPLSLRQLNP